MCYFVRLLDCLFSDFHTVLLFCYCEGKFWLYKLRLNDVRCRVYIWEFSCLDYPFDVLILRIGNVILYNWLCLYLFYLVLSVLSILYYFLSLGDNLGYMNSGYDDVRYRVYIYIWEFPYLDYSFDILISWSRKSSLYSWFCLYSILLVLLVLCCFCS